MWYMYSKIIFILFGRSWKHLDLETLLCSWSLTLADASCIQFVAKCNQIWEKKFLAPYVGNPIIFIKNIPQIKWFHELWELSSSLKVLAQIPPGSWTVIYSGHSLCPPQPCGVGCTALLCYSLTWWDSIGPLVTSHTGTMVRQMSRTQGIYKIYIHSRLRFHIAWHHAILWVRLDNTAPDAVTQWCFTIRFSLNRSQTRYSLKENPPVNGYKKGTNIRQRLKIGVVLKMYRIIEKMKVVTLGKL